MHWGWLGERKGHPDLKVTQVFALRLNKFVHIYEKISLVKDSHGYYPNEILLQARKGIWMQEPTDKLAVT